jgi:minor histocompatibility antigen H13
MRCTFSFQRVACKRPGVVIAGPNINLTYHRRWHTVSSRYTFSKRALITVGAATRDEHEDVTGRTTAASSTTIESWQWDGSPDALRTYAVFLGVLGIGAIPTLESFKYADLVYFISLALSTIYIGAHRGLNSRQRQEIDFREGLLAPIAASLALFGTYLLVKYFPELSLQRFFDAYFWFLGTLAFIGAFAQPAREAGKRLAFPVWTVPIPQWIGAVDAQERPITQGGLALTDIVVVLGGLALASADLATHHGNFTLNNTIACLVAADILQLVGLSSFRVATLLLVGLLLYDVFWVFGSPKAVGENVMLQVATSNVLVGPTRLIFPKIPGNVGEASNFPFALLGLGDVAVPGLLACLALRYDASRAVDLRSRGIAAAEAIQEALSALPPNASGDEIADAAGAAAESAYDKVADMEVEQQARTQGMSASGEVTTVYLPSDSVLHQRTYFVPVMISYIIGLSAAFAANAITGLGQPALLYIVPMTLGTVGMVAISRKELLRLCKYTSTVTPKPTWREEVSSPDKITNKDA